jgi:hypothetical protein
VREVVGFDTSIQDSLARGYANISALARVVKPDVEKRIGRRINLQSVVTALKRLKHNYTGFPREISRVIAKSSLNVRTHVSKMSVERTKRNLDTVSLLLRTHQEEFIQFAESLSALTLIFDQKEHRKFRKRFDDSSVFEEGDDYAAIIVHSPPLITPTPGCIMSFYTVLARRHINIEDTLSCYTDTIILVKMRDASRAFESLTELIDGENRGNR